MRWSGSKKGFLPTLAVAFSLAIIATLAAVLLGFTVARSLRSDLTRSVEHAHRLAQVHELRFEIERVVSASRGYLISGQGQRREKALSAIVAARGALDALEKPATAPRRGPMIEEVHRTSVAYLDAIEAALGSEEWKGQRAASLFQDELAPKRDQLESSLARLVHAEDEHAEAQFQESAESAGRNVMLLLVLGGVSVLLTAGSAWFFGTSLARSYAVERGGVVRAERAVAAREDLLAIIARDLQSLADAATIEAGRLSLSTEPCAVGFLLKAAVDIFEPLAVRKAIRLTLAATVAEDLRVRADRERAIQVLSNLLANAVRFTPEGGAITVNAEPVGTDVRFSVRDNGPEIPADHLPYLFSRYGKAEAGGRRGAGLGLYIAKGIVEAHAGKVWVDSAPGKGSTFFFTMPSVDMPPETAPPVQSPRT